MMSPPRRPESSSAPEAGAGTATTALPPALAIFREPRNAESAVRALLALGLDGARISVVCPRGISLHFERDERVGTFHPPRQGVPEGVGEGAGIGALLASALVIGLTTPLGVGAFVVAGPLFGGVATGAVTGGLVGAMLRRGMRPDVADHYDQAVRAGRILVAAEPVSEKESATVERAFEDAGAEPLPAD